MLTHYILAGIFPHINFSLVLGTVEKENQCEGLKKQTRITGYLSIMAIDYNIVFCKFLDQELETHKTMGGEKCLEMHILVF